MAKSDDRKLYKTFGNFITRNGFEKGNSMASLFIYKFALCSHTDDYKPIPLEEWNERGILPSGQHKTLTHLRKELIRLDILECEAKPYELADPKPNYKCNMYKPGKRIKKYIDRAIMENIPSRVNNLEYLHDTLSLKIDSKSDEKRIDSLEIALSERINAKADEIKVAERFEKLEKKVENLTALILKFAPPDDEVRRDIVEKNQEDYDKMKKLLDEDLKRRRAMI